MNKYKKMFDKYSSLTWGKTHDASFIEAKTTLAELVKRAIDKKVKLYIENEDNPDNIQIIYCKCPSCKTGTPRCYQYMLLRNLERRAAHKNFFALLCIP